MMSLRAMISPSFVGFIGPVNATPGVTPPDETIDGFPEFAFTVDTIKDPFVKEKLRKIARRIVASHNSGPNRIIGFEVHGHADQTLRIAAGPGRDRTEFEVSRDRAENAQQLLLQMIEEEGGKPIIAGIKANSEAKAFGSKHRIFKPATTDPQMRKNRRVEIFLKEFVPPPPRPSPPEPPPKPEVRTNFRVQIKSGTEFFFSTPIPGTALTVRISLNIIIFDVDRKEQAKFRATLLGKALPPLVPGSTSVNTSISVVEGPPQDFNALEGVRLGDFDGDLIMGQNPGIAGVGVGGGFFMFFEALRGPTRPNPVEVKGGNVIGVPQISLIGVTPQNGSLKMDGQPTKSP
jgi:hypothetical protein